MILAALKHMAKHDKEMWHGRACWRETPFTPAGAETQIKTAQDKN